MSVYADSGSLHMSLEGNPFNIAVVHACLTQKHDTTLVELSIVDAIAVVVMQRVYQNMQVSPGGGWDTSDGVKLKLESYKPLMPHILGIYTALTKLMQYT